MSEVRTSVVIPAYRAEATLPAVLTALHPQMTGQPREAVLVNSGSSGELPFDVASWPWLEVVSIGERLFPGAARNQGAAIARGELLAFLDAATVPHADWLDELENALTGDVKLVSGPVLNGTPESAWGTAGYVLEFLEWVPERETPLEHAAGCNLLTRRASFEQSRGFPEDMRAGEDTVFTFGFARDRQLAFAPRARVTHLNRVRPRAVLAHQRVLGSGWVQACARAPLPGASLAVPYLAPLATLGRMWAIVKLLWKYPHHLGSFTRRGALLILGLLAWGLGVAQYSGTRGGVR